MRRTIAVLALSALAATFVGSAASLAVEGGALQAGTASAQCDVDGVNIAWGLETDTSQVSYLRVEGIDLACVGSEMFVKVFGVDESVLYDSGKQDILLEGNMKLTFPAPLDLAPIQSTTVWISS